LSRISSARTSSSFSKSISVGNSTRQGAHPSLLVMKFEIEVYMWNSFL
jgi:hypothetical protein